MQTLMDEKMHWRVIGSRMDSLQREVNFVLQMTDQLKCMENGLGMDEEQRDSRLVLKRGWVKKTLYLVSATGHITKKNKWMRTSADSQEMPHFHMS